jgi:hypothetical protein
LELDAWGLDAMGLDKEPDAMKLDSMESGKDPDAMESDAGTEVLCHNLLSGHFFLDLCFLCFKEGALGSDMLT